MKWNIEEGISFEPGNRDPLAAAYNGTDLYFMSDKNTDVKKISHQAQKKMFRELGQYFNADSITVKRLSNNEFNYPVIVFHKPKNGEYVFCYVDENKQIHKITMEELTENGNIPEQPELMESLPQ